MRKISLFILFILCAGLVSAQLNNQIQKTKFHWGKEQNSTSGYTQGLKVDNVLYISGTVAREINPEGIKQVYDVLEKTLQHYGAKFQNVVKEYLFTTDIEAMKQFNDVRKAYYSEDYPAATWVQISRLFTADSKLEVELIAHLPKTTQ